MAIKLDTLPPEILLQILSHLDPVHYFPLKAAGSHYITQIVRSSYPVLSYAEWVQMLYSYFGIARCAEWKRIIRSRVPASIVLDVPHIEREQATAIIQGRAHFVERLITTIQAQSLRNVLIASADGGFRLGGLKRVFSRSKDGSENRSKRLARVTLRKYMLELRLSLCLAAAVNSEFLVRMVLDAGVVDDVDACEYMGMNAVHLAALNGHVGCVRALLKGGARSSVAGPDGQTAFHIAADNGDVEMMRVLLDGLSKAAALNIVSAVETSALSIAATKDNPTIVRLLLDAGASINSGGDWFIVMISAARGGDPKIMELLLDYFNRELESTATDKKPNLWRVVDAAASSGFRDTIQKIIDSGFEYIQTHENGPYITPLHIAASKGHTAAVKLFLDRELYVDIPTPDGLTPIQTAVYFNKLNALQVFVEKGYPLKNHPPKRGGGNSNEPTLVHILAESPFFTDRSVLDYLLDSGLDIHAKAGDQQLTPMHYAFGAQLLVGVRFLSDAGGDVNARGLHGQTPLMIMVAQPHVEENTLKRAMNFKPNPNQADDYGNRPIHVAAHYNEIKHYYEDVIESLVYYGAEVNGKNNAGQAVIHIAAQRNKADTVAWLLRYCADAMVRDHKMMTPLHYLRIGEVMGASLTEIKLRAAWGDMEARDSKGRTPEEMIGLEEERIVMPYGRFTRVQWKRARPRPKPLYDPPEWTEFVKSLRE